MYGVCLTTWTEMSERCMLTYKSLNFVSLIAPYQPTFTLGDYDKLTTYAIFMCLLDLEPNVWGLLDYMDRDVRNVVPANYQFCVCVNTILNDRGKAPVYKATTRKDLLNIAKQINHEGLQFERTDGQVLGKLCAKVKDDSKNVDIDDLLSRVGFKPEVKDVTCNTPNISPPAFEVPIEPVKPVKPKTVKVPTRPFKPPEPKMPSVGSLMKRYGCSIPANAVEYKNFELEKKKYVTTLSDYRKEIDRYERKKKEYNDLVQGTDYAKEKAKYDIDYKEYIQARVRVKKYLEKKRDNDYIVRAMNKEQMEKLHEGISKLKISIRMTDSQAMAKAIEMTEDQLKLKVYEIWDVDEVQLPSDFATCMRPQDYKRLEYLRASHLNKINFHDLCKMVWARFRCVYSNWRMSKRSIRKFCPSAKPNSIRSHGDEIPKTGRYKIGTVKGQEYMEDYSSGYKINKYNTYNRLYNRVCRFSIKRLENKLKPPNKRLMISSALSKRMNKTAPKYLDKKQKEFLMEKEEVKRLKQDEYKDARRLLYAQIPLLAVLDGSSSDS
jgi:hypothetical protein